MIAPLPAVHSSAPYDRAVSEAPTKPAGIVGGRISSLDVLRGIAVVLMAIDHVRVFSAVPAGGPTLGIFFTRWVTNFVAPLFVFLAGTAAYLYGRKLGDTRRLAGFLASRGLLLVLLELTVIRFSWTFNVDYGTYLLAGVIWVIGWSMVVLGGFVFLPTRAVAGIGLVLVFGHNMLPALLGAQQQSIEASPVAWLFQLLYFHGAIELGTNGGGPSLVVLYVLIPWLGVICAGYGFGALYELDQARRRRLLYRIGGGAVALFLALRFFEVYGDSPWRADNRTGMWPNLREFLNTSKYPASLQFLLMTLGPAILLLPHLERARNRVTQVLEVFGRVPMFYYLLHIPLIHALACVVSLARTGSITPWLFGNHPMWPPEPPPGYQWSLALLYLVTAIAVGMLYFACRWYGRIKATNPRPWMRYL
jgi:uncharacterized membrane protein